MLKLKPKIKGILGKKREKAALEAKAPNAPKNEDKKILVYKNEKDAKEEGKKFKFNFMGMFKLGKKREFNPETKSQNAPVNDGKKTLPDKNEKREEKEAKKIKFSFLRAFNLGKKSTGQKNSRVDYFKKKIEAQEKKRIKFQERKHRLRFYIEKAGLNINPSSLSKNLFNLCVFINVLISALLIYHFSVTFGISWTTILMSIATLWILVFILILFVLWILFYIVVDLRIFKRKVDIEEVLPDYLQLTASNIKAGMTIDRALWYAVRPRFGVLAKEIETVAKETMKGEDLKIALQKFADKYDSALLKRSISLLIEGIDAGGEIGDLLNKIAVNIQENKITTREMAANVTTYIIFIAFATIGAAPMLFALSGVLIRVISDLGGTLGDTTSAATSAGFGISFSGSGIEYSDFRIFAIVCLIITSFFSAAIIATIKKGDIRTGLKYIPIFIVVTVILFLIADKVLGKMVGVFF